MDTSKPVTIYLKPGEYYVATDPVMIKTILGSCVSICLHDRVKKIGGANHYILPRESQRGGGTGQYGELAVPELIQMLIREGSNINHLVAQIAGGGCTRENAVLDVGKKNIELAREVLKQYSIPIIREEVGANFGRVIRFFPHTNKLEVKQAGKPDQPEQKSTKSASEENFVQLTMAQTMKLKMELSQGLAYAEKTLTTMIGKPVLIKVADINLRQMGYAQDYLSNKFGDFMVSTGQKEKGSLGEVAMMIDPNRAPLFINALLRRPIHTEVKYDRMESSVVVEIANIVLNGILGTLANHLGFAMMLRVPQFVRTQNEMRLLPFMDNKKKWKVCLALKSKLQIPALEMDTLLLLLVELASPYGFFRKLE